MIYNYRFLWCCHATRWGIQQYHAAKMVEPATHDGPRRTVDAPAVHSGGRVVAE